MKNFLLSILTFIMSCGTKAPKNSISKADSIYDFTMKDIKGNDVSLSKYKGKVVVIVNTASKCGLTPQYESMQKFYEQYKDKGVEVIGFPANNFLYQEPGTEEEIASFCSLNYHVTFDMYAKIDVKSADIAPLYQYLTKKSLNGVKDAPVLWNFHKFIIDRNGKMRYDINPKTTVSDTEFLDSLATVL
jgi:glutathione peroxidase